MGLGISLIKYRLHPKKRWSRRIHEIEKFILHRSWILADIFPRRRDRATQQQLPSIAPCRVAPYVGFLNSAVKRQPNFLYCATTVTGVQKQMMVNREDELFAEIDNSGSFERWCKSGRPHSGHQEQKPKGSGSRSDKHERSIAAKVGFWSLCMNGCSPFC